MASSSPSNLKIAYLPAILSEYYRGIPDFTSQFIETKAALDIQQFLASPTVTLTPVRQNQQDNSLSPSGTILFPLCIQSKTFHTGSTDWKAGMTLLRALVPLLRSCETVFRIHHGNVHGNSSNRNRALQNLPANVEKRMDLPGLDGCFHSMRLTANVAVDPVRPHCGHPNPWCVVAVVGELEGGLWTLRRVRHNLGEVKAGSGDLLIVENDMRIGVGKHKGAGYQLEFFLSPGTRRK